MNNDKQQKNAWNHLPTGTFFIIIICSVLTKLAYLQTYDVISPEFSVMQVMKLLREFIECYVSYINNKHLLNGHYC